MYGNTVRMNDSKHRQCFGGHSERETPGHIPNPEAKTLSADGTAGVTLWESRTPPDSLCKGPPFGVALWRLSSRRADALPVPTPSLSGAADRRRSGSQEALSEVPN